MGLFSKLTGGSKKKDKYAVKDKGAGKGAGKGGKGGKGVTEMGGLGEEENHPEIPLEINPFIVFDETSFTVLSALADCSNNMMEILSRGRERAEEIRKDIEYRKKIGEENGTHGEKEFNEMETRLTKIENMCDNFLAFAEQLDSVARDVNEELGSFDVRIHDYIEAKKKSNAEIAPLEIKEADRKKAKTDETLKADLDKREAALKIKKDADARDLQAKLHAMDRVVEVVANEGSLFHVVYGAPEEGDADWMMMAAGGPAAGKDVRRDDRLSSEDRDTPRGDQALAPMTFEEDGDFANVDLAEQQKKQESDFAARAGGRKSAIVQKADAARKSMAAGRKSVAVGRKSTAAALKPRKTFLQQVEDGSVKVKKAKAAKKDEEPEQEWTAEDWAKWEEEGGEEDEEWTDEQWAMWEKAQAEQAQAEGAAAA